MSTTGTTPSARVPNRRPGCTRRSGGTTDYLLQHVPLRLRGIYTRRFTPVSGPATVAFSGPAASAYPPTPPDAATSRIHLGTLVVSAPGSMSGYSRDKFPHWIAQPSDGANCDTREVVLKRDGTGVTTGSDCYPTGGSWYSVYDRTTTTDPSKVQIDRIVPLANAWVSGASSWTTAKRQSYASDLTDPQLIAVSASSNESKGDRDRSAWKPPNQGEWCFYARNWIQVKYVFALHVTSSEKSAPSSMLDTC